MKKLLLFALIIVLASCEKMIVPESEDGQDSNGNVIL